VDIDELARSFSIHRLVIVSDGICLLDPLTGQLEQWGVSFERWRARFLLTPRPPEIWGPAEQVINETGLRVLSATGEGLLNLARIATKLDVGDQFEAAQFTPVQQAERVRPYPRRLELGMLRQAVVPKEELDEIMLLLRRYLRPRTFAWLTACAVFPKVQPQLTRHIGAEVHVESPTGYRPLFSERGFLSLQCLPWFRVGFIPDWMRLALVRRMPSELRDQVVRALHNVLERQPPPAQIAAI